jgi:hypothetical protein
VPEIQDGVSGLKNGRGERFGHGDFPFSDRIDGKSRGNGGGNVSRVIWKWGYWSLGRWKNGKIWRNL